MTCGMMLAKLGCIARAHRELVGPFSSRSTIATRRRRISPPLLLGTTRRHGGHQRAWLRSCRASEDGEWRGDSGSGKRRYCTRVRERTQRAMCFPRGRKTQPAGSGHVSLSGLSTLYTASIRSPSVAMERAERSRPSTRSRSPVSPFTAARCRVSRPAKRFSSPRRSRTIRAAPAMALRPAGTRPRPSAVQVASGANERPAVAGFHGGVEAAQQADARALRGPEPPALALHPLSGPMDDLPAGRLAFVERPGDLRVVAVEDVVEEERGPLLRREALEKHHERDRQVRGQLDVPVRGRRLVAKEHLRQPWPDVGLALDLERAQTVDGEARRRR